MGGAGFGTYWLVVYPEDAAQLTDLLPEHNEVFGYHEADDHELVRPWSLISVGMSLPP